MIQLPIEIGDTILTGKFKNKKVTVKEIGQDSYGNPTINGKNILKIRMPKLYQENNMNLKENTIKPKDLINKYVYTNKGYGTIVGYKYGSYIIDLDDGGTIRRTELITTTNANIDNNSFKLKDWVVKKRTVSELLHTNDITIEVKQKDEKKTNETILKENITQTQLYNAAKKLSQFFRVEDRFDEILKLLKTIEFDNNGIPKNDISKLSKMLNSTNVNGTIHILKASLKEVNMSSSEMKQRMLDGIQNDGTAFEIRGAYGNCELWANGNRLEAGSIKDCYNTWIKYRFNPKYEKKTNENTLKESMKPFQKSPIEVKIKQDEGRWKIYLQGLEEEECLSIVGYETKELAEHAAMMKGYSFDGNPYNEKYKGIEVPKATKAEPIKYDKPKETNLGKENTLKIEAYIKKVVKEELSKKKVQLKEEIEINDSEVEEYAALVDKIDKMKAELSKLTKRFDELDDKFKKMLDVLESELGESKENFIRYKNILITIKRKGYERTNYKYKEAFEELYKKVNANMKKMIDEVLEANKTITKISSSLSVQYEADNFVTNIFNKVKNWFVSFIGRLRNTNKNTKYLLDQLESKV